MRKTVLVVAGLAVALAAAFLVAAAPKQYQFTGTVTEIDASTLSVDKGGEVWQFSIEGMKPTAKKGDKVTVYYTMVAKKIEAK